MTINKDNKKMSKTVVATTLYLGDFFKVSQMVDSSNNEKTVASVVRDIVHEYFQSREPIKQNDKTF